MKNLLIFFAFAAIFNFAGCKQKPQSQKDSKTLFNWENAQIYVSENGETEFLTITDSEVADGIVLLDKNSGTVYQLDQVEAASGVKYANQEGLTFWTKGNDFIWSNHMDVIASGKLKTIDFSGNYVSPDYFQRSEGYDWVAVRVKTQADNQMLFQVRSRSDKKKPTCTLDAKAFREDSNHYYSIIDGKKVFFTFIDDSLQIAPDNPEDENVLFFYCSGGATVAGTYVFIEEELDPDQVDPTAFSKILRLQEIGFNVSAVRDADGWTEISVTPFGLETDNSVQKQKVEGSIVDAEVEDLNSDGSPELLIYTQSDGSGSYGNVVAYSVNNRKSMSMVYFPNVSEDSTLSKGYMGHDQFRVVEHSLVQRFPIYNEGDSNSSPGGGIRQISYQLAEGEAMRRFTVKNISTFNR